MRRLEHTCNLCGRCGEGAMPTCVKCVRGRPGWNVLRGKPSAADLKYLEWLNGKAADGSPFQH